MHNLIKSKRRLGAICTDTSYHTPYACPRLSKSITFLHRSGCKERVDTKCYSANEHQLGDGAHTLDEDTLARAFCACQVDRRDVGGGELYRERCPGPITSRNQRGDFAYLGPPLQDNPPI